MIRKFLFFIFISTLSQIMASKFPKRPLCASIRLLFPLARVQKIITYGHPIHLSVALFSARSECILGSLYVYSGRISNTPMLFTHTHILESVSHLKANYMAPHASMGLCRQLFCISLTNIRRWKWRSAFSKHHIQNAFKKYIRITYFT